MSSRSYPEWMIEAGQFIPTYNKQNISLLNKVHWHYVTHFHSNSRLPNNAPVKLQCFKYVKSVLLIQR